MDNGIACLMNCASNSVVRTRVEIIPCGAPCAVTSTRGIRVLIYFSSSQATRYFMRKSFVVLTRARRLKSVFEHAGLQIDNVVENEAHASKLRVVRTEQACGLPSPTADARIGNKSM